MITSELIFAGTGHRYEVSSFGSLGLADCDLSDNVLTFLDSRKYATAVNKNPHIKVFLLPKKMLHFCVMTLSLW